MSVVSSANEKVSLDLVDELMSLMYSRNSVVERTEPWGIPCLMRMGSEVAVRVCRVWILFVKYEWKKAVVLGWKLKL